MSKKLQLHAAHHEKMLYALSILILILSIVYFVVAWQAMEELTGAQSSEEKLGSTMEVTLFSIVGAGYLGIGVWAIKKRLETSLPYVIVAVGSIIMIGIYMIAITSGVPILGIESETDPLATIAKILQGAIIGIAVFIIPYTPLFQKKWKV